ncbi:MAG: pilus assembly FimT family protein [Planctomycetota bacterium]
MRNERGYTLIELIIVIALLGLATTLLVPYLVNQDSMTVQAAVRRVIADLTFAQSDALAHQEYRRVHFYEDGRGYCLYRVDDTNFEDDFDAATADFINDPLGGVGGFRAFIVDFTLDDRFEGVQITAGAVDGETLVPDGVDVTYDALGGTVQTGYAPGTGGQITLTFDDSSYRIVVAPFTGKLTVEKIS